MGKYLQNNLKIGENLLCEAKLTWAVIVPHCILLIVGVGIITLPIVALRTWFRRAITELGFTEKQIIGKTGWINTNAMNSPLNKIQNVQVKSGFWGKVFKFGDIHITTAAGNYTFKGIENPENFKMSLMNQIDQYDEDRIRKQAEEMARAIKQNT